MRTTQKPTLLLPRILMALTAVLFPAGTNGQGQPKPQTQPTPQTTQPTPKPNFTSIIAKTVAFITVPYKEGTAIKGVSGTCFLVGVPDDRLGKGGYFVYMVTNRHVATAEGVPSSELLPEVYVRVNLVQPDGGDTAAESPIPFGGERRWYFPDDPKIDLAALPVNPNAKTLDMRVIPLSIFATNEVLRSQSIGLGDPVFFVGYFSQFPGIQRAEPIYRSGALAMMPIDPIPMIDKTDDTTTPEHLYLADVHAFLGNSGAPLFVNIGGLRNGALTMMPSPDYLIGVVNGFIPERNGKVTAAATLEGSKGTEPNSGILTFVPAQELRDFLYSTELQKLRDHDVAAQKKQ